MNPSNTFAFYFSSIAVVSCCMIYLQLLSSCRMRSPSARRTNGTIFGHLFPTRNVCFISLARWVRTKRTIDDPREEYPYKGLVCQCSGRPFLFSEEVLIPADGGCPPREMKDSKHPGGGRSLSFHQSSRLHTISGVRIAKVTKDLPACLRSSLTLISALVCILHWLACTALLI